MRTAITTKTGPSIKWTESIIRAGVERFIIEEGRPPTAVDFDGTPYLPSSRQVQRAFGGLAALRQQLGYVDLDFTKGQLRGEIAVRAGKRGMAAENVLEPILVAKFGEAYVHTQKHRLLARFPFISY